MCIVALVQCFMTKAFVYVPSFTVRIMMSGVNSDQLHRSTLTIYSNLMEQFNPGLQRLVTLGNNYVKAFQALAVTSEAYFSALAKMGEHALRTISSRSLGDVLIQISETQRKLTVEVEGLFHWFHVEVLQALDKNVKLDEEYIDGSRRVYELEVRNQAAALERQLRRGAYRDSLGGSNFRLLQVALHEGDGAINPCGVNRKTDKDTLSGQRQQNSKENTTGNSKENTTGNSKENTTGNSKENTTGNSNENSKENTTGNSNENSKEKLKENSKENLKENSTGNSKENSTGNSKENTTGNSKENSTGNSKENSTGHSKENTTGNSKENSRENSKENLKENSKDNSKENSIGNSKENLKENLKENSTGNSKENTTGKFKGELKGELEGELNRELKGELKGELEGELEREHNRELKGELNRELKGELKGELEGELEGELKGEHNRKIQRRTQRRTQQGTQRRTQRRTRRRTRRRTQQGTQRRTQRRTRRRTRRRTQQGTQRRTQSNPQLQSESSEYMQYLRQSQHEILREEERRYRFLAEKHCGLTHTLLFLINKTGASLQQKADGWKERVNESRSSRPRTPTPLEHDVLLRTSVSSLLQTGDNVEAWAGKDHQMLGRVPSRAPSPLPSRSRSNSVGESLGLGGGRPMRALVSHPASSNPVLLPFSSGEVLTVLIPEARNGWLYGRHNSSLRQGWFPAAYVAPVEDFPSLSSSGTSLRSHSMNNLLEPNSQSESTDIKNNAELPAPAPPIRRASADLRPISPIPDRKVEGTYETKTNQKSYSEIPPPAPPIRRASADFRPVSPLLDRRAESHFESKVEPKGYSQIPPPAPPLPKPADVRPVSPLPEKKSDTSAEVSMANGSPHQVSPLRLLGFETKLESKPSRTVPRAPSLSQSFIGGHGTLPTGHCPKDAAHRTLPRGHWPQDAAHKTPPARHCPQNAAHRTLPIGHDLQDTAFRTLPTERCPEDTGHRTLRLRMLPSGRCPQDTAHRTLPRGHWPQDAAHRTLPIGHDLQDTAFRTLPTERCPEDTGHRTLPTGHCPQDATHRTLPRGHWPQDTASQDASLRTLPTGHCPQDTALQDAALRMLTRVHCPQDAFHTLLSSGCCPEDEALRTLSTRRFPHVAALRILPRGRCPQDADQSTLPSGRFPHGIKSFCHSETPAHSDQRQIGTENPLTTTIAALTSCHCSRTRLRVLPVLLVFNLFVFCLRVRQLYLERGGKEKNDRRRRDVFWKEEGEGERLRDEERAEGESYGCPRYEEKIYISEK
ncbi:hypothetical protein NFI96_027647, partial [Prochilodus magdalenae]